MSRAPGRKRRACGASAYRAACPDERRYRLDLIGPDAAGIVCGQPRKLLRRIYSGRELAAAIGAEHEDLAVGRLHAVEETVGPAPHPRGDVDRQHHHRVVAGFRHHAAPAVADVAEQAALDGRARNRSDIGHALAHDLDRLVAAIDHDLRPAFGGKLVQHGRQLLSLGRVAALHVDQQPRLRKGLPAPRRASASGRCPCRERERSCRHRRYSHGRCRASSNRPCECSRVTPWPSVRQSSVQS